MTGLVVNDCFIPILVVNDRFTPILVANGCFTPVVVVLFHTDLVWEEGVVRSDDGEGRQR